jgi:hypothetical protein
MPTGVLGRLHTAQNRHDLDAFLACFDGGTAPGWMGRG